MKTRALILSCEHAVNSIPEAYQGYFAAHQDLLNSHRGIDFGALNIASYLSKVFACPMIAAKTSRLLIDCNRGLSHPQCFSEISCALTKEEKQQIITDYYKPYRQDVEGWINRQIDAGQQVLHLSIHSFTPVLNEVKRNADLGLLYDPKRSNEKAFAQHWQEQLRRQDKQLRIRANYPYRGTSDGFTSALRKQFGEDDYIGIEVESNQALVHTSASLGALAACLAQSLAALIQTHKGTVG